MNVTYNVYCDESCHLENDHQTAMVLGALWCPVGKVKAITGRLREIKARHGVRPGFEVKWTKVSPAKVQMYTDLIDYFFDESDLHFRALIVPNKCVLRHDAFGQDHDTFYYKMYFDLLKVILSPKDHYRIYIDIKDTKSNKKIEKLQEVLCNNLYDFSRKIIERIQTVRSHEIELLQLTDLLIGAVSSANRGSGGSEAKRKLVMQMKRRSGYSLTRTTLLREEKVNLFRWHAQEV
ncbi:MAG: DUF3800 domain-containing protein [Firmicutes bacterium]|nr:DUF3800 domain-containing protein [Bacillota bacterium]